MGKMTLVVLLLLVGSIFISNEAFSAWTQAKGHSYNQLTYSYYSSDAKYDTLHENNTVGPIFVSEQPFFRSISLTYYGAYGITDTLTASLTVPYKWFESGDINRYGDDRGPSGVGDIDFGLRYNLTKNLLGSGALMSVDAKVKIPEAYDYGNPIAEQSLGDGQYDTTLSMVFGKGFSWGYSIIDIGYKYRFENNQHASFKPSDQLKVRIDGGTPFPFIDDLWFRWSADWSKSVGNAKISTAMLDDFIYNKGGEAGGATDKLIRDTLALEQNTLILGAALAYSITPKIQAVVGVEAVSRGVGIFKSRDTGKGKTYSVALVYMH